MVVLLLSDYSSGPLSFSKELSLVISLTQVLIWIVIAAVVGFFGACILIASSVPFLVLGDGGDGRFRPQFLLRERQNTTT